MNNRYLPVLLLAGLVASGATPGARAAESYDNCTGFIDSLPATISTQGVWCLRNHLSTAATSGAGITIATNNVTIDCNDFKVGNLAAGVGTDAVGILALNRRNASIRRCTTRGFAQGIYLSGASSSGHVIEDNRIEASTSTGISASGDGSVVRRNTVLDIGGRPGVSPAGIYAGGAVDVQDNTIVGVLPDDVGNLSAYGIRTLDNSGADISGNRIRGVLSVGSGSARGIYNASSGRVTIVDNYLVGDDRAGGQGLACASNLGRARDNIVADFPTSISGCSNDGNVASP